MLLTQQEARSTQAVCPWPDAKGGTGMSNPSTEFTLLRYLHLLFGIALYTVDVGTDIWVAAQFGRDGHYAWLALTLSLVLGASLATQIFSYAWFCDDMEKGESLCGMTRSQLIIPHVLQLGMFMRYFQLLRKGVSAMHGDYPEAHQEMIAMATDTSMLRLFETFLESAPQLLLQLYIILAHNHGTAMQYVCMAGSLLSIAWATVEYRRCFRSSLPHLAEMPSGLPTAVYLLYKLFTIASRIASLSLLVVLNVHCASALVLVWLGGTVWAHCLRTDFCTSRLLEGFYRGVVGVVLIFTFFNVKGQGTRASMAVYYELYVSQNLAVLLAFYLLKSSDGIPGYFRPAAIGIAGSTVVGLVCLLVFYAFLHTGGDTRLTDEVDGREQSCETAQDLRIKSNEMRMKAFLQH